MDAAAAGMESRNGQAAGTKRMAVIGAGACGLTTAKHMLEAGFDVTIFEIGTQVGGLWCYENDSGRSSAYKTLHINTAKNLTNFSDLKFADDVQAFPDHWDMHKYLGDYADHFDLRRHILFKSEVKHLRPAFRPGAEAPRWEVETTGGTVRTFDTVLIATGHLTKPLHAPEIRDHFKGEYLHAHDYREPEPYEGKRVCVVGIGNTALDIVSDVCVGARRTVMVARSGILIAPKLLFGFPFTDVTMKLYRHWIPEWLRMGIIKGLVYLMHGSMTRLGFPPLAGKVHAASNATAVQHIAYRRVTVKQGIEGIEGRTIRFVDGTAEAFDTVIAATGYLMDLPFISGDIVPLRDNHIDLYKNMVPPGWPGLYLMGMFNTDTALNQVFEWQAKWVCAFERGDAVLPSDDAMRADIAAYRAWVKRHYKQTSRHTIEVEHLPYSAALWRALTMGRLRAWWRRFAFRGAAGDAPVAAEGSP